jgi:hypothetical protein
MISGNGQLEVHVQSRQAQTIRKIDKTQLLLSRSLFDPLHPHLCSPISMLPVRDMLAGDMGG